MEKVKRRIYIIAPTFAQALFHFTQFRMEPRVWLSTIRENRTEIETRAHIISARPIKACKNLKGTFVYFGPDCKEWRELNENI